MQLTPSCQILSILNPQAPSPRPGMYFGIQNHGSRAKSRRWQIRLIATSYSRGTPSPEAHPYKLVQPNRHQRQLGVSMFHHLKGDTDPKRRAAAGSCAVIPVSPWEKDKSLWICNSTKVKVHSKIKEFRPNRH